MKAFKFTRTVIVWGTNEQDAENALGDMIDDGEISTDLSDWYCEGQASEYEDIDLEN